MKSQGKTKLGWLLLRQAVQLAQDLGMFRAPLILHSDLEMMPLDMQHVRTITAWGVFIMNTYYLPTVYAQKTAAHSYLGTCP